MCRGENKKNMEKNQQIWIIGLSVWGWFGRNQIYNVYVYIYLYLYLSVCLSFGAFHEWLNRKVSSSSFLCSCNNLIISLRCVCECVFSERGKEKDEFKIIILSHSFLGRRNRNGTDHRDRLSWNPRMWMSYYMCMCVCVEMPLFIHMEIENQSSTISDCRARLGFSMKLLCWAECGVAWLPFDSWCDRWRRAEEMVFAMADGRII